MISDSYAQVWKTLPQGVRMLGYRNVTTTTINSEYNQGQAETPLSYSLNANASSLASISDSVSYYLEQLRTINPAAYDQFSYGQFTVGGEARLNVNGLGLGWGLTDRLTVYGIMTYYSANVRVKYKQLKQSNTQEIADSLGGASDGDDAIAAITAALPSSSGNMLQSVIVNTYGYNEVGDWYGAGYGDTELGATYGLIDRGYWGLSLTGGVTAPTGREDDPDLLQDIAFGDGQWDVFTEAAIGYAVNDALRFGSYLRYTYQAPADKTLRIPTSREIPLSANKGSFNVKYGDRVDASFLTTATVNDWLSFTPAYEFFYQLPSNYESSYGAANDYLAYNSDRMGHTARFSTSVSSIQPYLKKKFVLPATLSLHVQQTIAGKNVPKVGRFELELKLLF